MLQLVDVMTPVVRDSYPPLGVCVALAIAAWSLLGVACWVRARVKGMNDE